MMDEDAMILATIRWVLVAIFAVAVPCCTAEDIYKEHTYVEMIQAGADPLELGCMYGRLDSERCTLLISKDHKE